MAIALAPTTAPAATLRAAIYCRVSTPGQKEDGYSLEGQVDECLALAERIGATVAPHHVYREVGSGADWNLPDLLDLLDRAQRREFDVVLALATSRLARDVGKLAVLQRTLKRSDVTIQYVHHQFDDTPTGQLTETMLAAIDVYERQNSALRFALGKRAKLARQLVMGIGPTPYGYTAVRNEKGSTIGLEIDSETGPVVQRIFREAVRRTFWAIGVRLDAEGIMAPKGGSRWSEKTMREMVANPVYLGRSAYGRRRAVQTVGSDGRRREVLYPRDESEWQFVECPALVTTAQRDTALAGIAERKRHHGGRRRADPSYEFTLRGMLTCGLCNGPMAVCRNNGTRYYLCLRYWPVRAAMQGREKCALPSVPADLLEAEVWRLLRDVLLDEQRLRDGLEDARRANRDEERKRERLKDLRAEIAQLEKALDKQTVELLRAEAGSATEAALRRAGKELEARITALQQSATELESQPVPGLSSDDIDAIEQFAAEVRAGMDVVTSAEQHRIFTLLKVRGTVIEDPVNGVQLRRRRFSIDWQAILPLRHETTRFSTLPGR
jgi:site-specific DNA recombinase